MMINKKKSRIAQNRANISYVFLSGHRIIIKTLQGLCDVYENNKMDEN